jgi:heme oxygenase
LGFTRIQFERLPQRIWPEITDAGQFLGTLYVREGSTRGGLMLAKALDRTLPTDAGRRFLLGRGCDAGLWERLLVTLETASADGFTPRMIAGAGETFAAMESWLDSR